ncbi:MAG: hypothetical protein V1808_03910 [Candidatus Daviesbacteria bacterium]
MQTEHSKEINCRFPFLAILRLLSVTQDKCRNYILIEAEDATLKTNSCNKTKNWLYLLHD